MLTGWFAAPPGPKSPVDDVRSDSSEEDTQQVEPEQGNGGFSPLILGSPARPDIWGKAGEADHGGV